MNVNLYKYKYVLNDGDMASILYISLSISISSFVTMICDIHKIPTVLTKSLKFKKKKYNKKYGKYWIIITHDNNNNK